MEPQHDELRIMRESVEALRELTGEIRQSHQDFRLVLFGDKEKGIVGLVNEVGFVKTAVAKIERRLMFYAGAISVVSMVAPILLSYVLK